jgi:hypothetical protein
MIIPARFKLASRTWKVKRGARMKALGDCDAQRCVIRLSRHNKSGEEELHTFMHELVHAVYFTLGWKRANDNEQRVDALASVLVQAFTTMEFEESQHMLTLVREALVEAGY